MNGLIGSIESVLFQVTSCVQRILIIAFVGVDTYDKYALGSNVSNGTSILRSLSGPRTPFSSCTEFLIITTLTFPLISTGSLNIALPYSVVPLTISEDPSGISIAEPGKPTPNVKRSN